MFNVKAIERSHGPLTLLKEPGEKCLG